MNAPVSFTAVPAYDREFRAPCINIEAEQSLLGAILINNAAFALVSEKLKPEHFSEPLHARIYEVAAQVISAGRVATPVTLKTHLGDHDLGGITISQYLARLAAEATTVINAPDYACTVIDLALRRDLIARGHALIDSAADTLAGEDAGKVLEEHESGLADMRNALASGSQRAMTLDAAALGVVQRIESRRRGDADTVPTSGFGSIDNALSGGFRPGRLIVIGGRPGMYKTGVGIASAHKTAAAGNGVGFFSLEIDENEMAARFIAAHCHDAGLQYSDVLAGTIHQSYDQTVESAYADFRDFPVEIDCSTGLTIGAIESRARSMADRLKRKGFNLDVLYIDYLGLIRPSGDHKGNKTAEIGDIALGAKELSRRLNCCVVLFSQLNRGVESRDDKRPVLTDLRDSGNIEEHADVIAFLYRPAYYDQKILHLLDKGAPPKDVDEFSFRDIAAARKNDLEIILEKNRLGARGTVELFVDVARSYVWEGR